MTYLGKIVNGAIVLADDVHLPDGTLVRVEPLDPKKADANAAESEPWKSLANFAGTIKGLPSDLAVNHDHYIHGTKKRE